VLGEHGYAGVEIDSLPQLWDGMAKLVREGLGLSAFGVQIWDLPDDYVTDSHNERNADRRRCTSRCTARAPC
jgi:hypothetical protein